MTQESKAAAKKKLKKPVKRGAPTEGLIFVSFNFDGKRYTQSHTLNATELGMLKGDMVEVGEATANTAISMAAVRNTAILAENVLARAFLDFIKKHHKPVRPTMAEAIEVLTKEFKEQDNALD